MCVVFDTAREYATANNPTLKTNRSLSRPIHRNILFGFAMFQHDVLNNHISKKPAALKAKGWMDGKSHFGEDFNGLRRHGNFKVVSANGRWKLRAGTKDVHLDKFYRLSIICLLSRATDRVGFEARMKEAVATILKQDRLDDDAALLPGTSSKRHTYFTQSGIMFGEGMAMFSTAYKSQRSNTGNTDSHNSSSSETIDMVTGLVRPRLADGSKFFVQAEGSASVNGQTWPGSTRPFTFPANGTVIESEPSSGEPSVTFRSSDVVKGIGFRGLMDRVQKGTHGKGNTKTKKIDRDELKEYELRYTAGIMRYSATTFHHINKHNVAEVHFVKKSEVTTTQSGRKRKTTDEEVKVQYEEEFESAVAVLKSKGIDSKKLQKGEVVVLLWCGFGVGQSSSSPYRKDTKKKKATELKAMLKERIATNTSWIEDTRRKLNAKKAVKTEE